MKDIKVWSPEEEAFLRRSYHEEDNDILAEELGRTTRAVRAKASRLGLRKTPKEDIDSNLRYCNQCKEFMDIDFFYAKRDSKKGVQSICISCNRQNNCMKELNKMNERRKELETSERTCKACGETKLGTEFPIFGKKDNSIYALNTCKKCKAKADADVIKKRIIEGKLW